MPRDTGTVTEVGVGNIQFYIPNGVSSHAECVFDPGDEFEVRTLDGLGLLLLHPEATPDVAAVADALDLEDTATHTTD